MKNDRMEDCAFLRQNFIFYLAGMLVILGIKLYYRQADCDSLLWILTPTTRWVEFLSGIPFSYISGVGYVNHSLRLLIAPSCSGVRFMTITFAMLAFSFVHIAALPRKGAGSLDFRMECGDSVGTDSLCVKGREPDGVAASAGSLCAKGGVPGRIAASTSLPRMARGLAWIAASMLFSWLFTVFANGLRIITAIYLPLYLQDAGLMGGMLTPERLHTMIGVVVYFVALLAIYRLMVYFVQRTVYPVFASQENGGQRENLSALRSGICRGRILEDIVRKCAPPVFWYFALTLGLPFLARANREGRAEFIEFAALVAGGCVLVLLPYCIMLFFRRGKRH